MATFVQEESDCLDGRQRLGDGGCEGWVERGDIPLNAVAKGAEGDDVVIREHDLEQGDVLHHGRGDGGDEEEDGGGEEEEGAEVVEESHFDDLFRSSLQVFSSGLLFYCS